MLGQPHVIDNRVFLLALDELYRESMKRHERAELLICARHVASTLNVTASDIAVEGYYAEDVRLTEYFRLMRALQEVEERRRSEVSGLPAFRRLDQVMSAPLYGSPQRQGKLLPVGRDALSEALRTTRPHWTVAQLTTAALAIARDLDDISLVGLAARVEDPVVLAALRESVVLYAEVMVLGMPPRLEIIWQVDDDLARLAGRFVGAFNDLFSERLPAPVADEADGYWRAYEAARIVGRCVRLGYDDRHLPVRHYHWAIDSGSEGQLTVREFWHAEVWTTARYRAAVAVNDRPDI